ncbi:MAG: sugar transferase [Microthrixaceae bacterium]
MSTITTDLTDVEPRFWTEISDARTKAPTSHAAGLVAKRAFDLVAATVLLLIALPVMAITAVVLRIAQGKQVIYCQTRVGQGGREFRIFKFRTMVSDADSMVIDLRDQNEADGLLFKLANDPRVTPLGKHLRTTALDELPQLWNVIRGDMSLVGPRPALPDEVAQYDRSLARRLDAKPGITGLWQVNGRHELTFEDYKRFDLHYVDHRNLALDVVILARTIPALLSRRGSH